MAEPDFSGLVDRALQVADRRRSLLLRLKQARQAGNVEKAFEIIDELVPDSVLDSHDKKVSSITSGQHRRTSRR
jgi:hypothetical protein